MCRDIIARSFPDERLRPQGRDEWNGPIRLPEAVADYSAQFGPDDVTIDGYGNPFFFPRLSALWEYQAGYRDHPHTNERFEDWEDDWLVIADEGADPFILSIATGKILHAYHGEGVWEPEHMFPNLQTMAASLLLLGEVVVTAGEDLTDGEGYIRKRYLEEAIEKLRPTLGPRSQAESVLGQLGWE